LIDWLVNFEFFSTQKIQTRELVVVVVYHQLQKEKSKTVLI
jgi:hypothetical protein